MAILELNENLWWDVYNDEALIHLSNYNVELDFLSIILNSPSVLNKIEDNGLKLPHYTDFSHPKTGLCFKAIQEFIDRYSADALQASALGQFIEDNQEMFTIMVNNAPYQFSNVNYFLCKVLTNFISSGDDYFSAKRLINIIIELSMRRKMHQLMVATQYTNINPNGKAADDIAHYIQDEIDRVIERHSCNSIMHKQHSFIAAAVEVVSEINQTDTVMRLPTGVNSIDELIGGFKAGTFNILAARPGIGKTALACQIAFHNANDENLKRPVFIFSLEMTLKELVLRRFASITKANISEIESKTISSAQWAEITRSVKEYLDKVSIFTDMYSVSPIEIRSALKSFIRTNNGVAPCLIIIDYFQLMTLKVNEPLDNQYAYADYKKIALELKKIAQEYDLAILALSQVGRSPSGRNELPQPEQLRGGVGINEVADLTFFLHRPDLKNNEEILVSVAKNRHGVVGETTVYYDGPHFTFYDK